MIRCNVCGELKHSEEMGKLGMVCNNCLDKPVHVKQNKEQSSA